MQDALSAGEIAARSGTSVATIHFYEAKGLIASTRTRGNQRRFARSELRRVAVIKVAQRAGISLGEIGEALATLPTGRTVTAKDWARMSRRWKAGLDRRIERLEALRDQLGECIGCGCLSIDSCPMRNPNDVAAEDGPGARYIDPLSS